MAFLIEDLEADDPGHRERRPSARALSRRARRRHTTPGPSSHASTGRTSSRSKNATSAASSSGSACSSHVADPSRRSSRDRRRTTTRSRFATTSTCARTRSVPPKAHLTHRSRNPPRFRRGTLAKPTRPRAAQRAHPGPARQGRPTTAWSAVPTPVPRSHRATRGRTPCACRVDAVAAQESLGREAGAPSHGHERHLESVQRIGRRGEQDEEVVRAVSPLDRDKARCCRWPGCCNTSGSNSSAAQLGSGVHDAAPWSVRLAGTMTGPAGVAMRM